MNALLSRLESLEGATLRDPFDLLSDAELVALCAICRAQAGGDAETASALFAWQSINSQARLSRTPEAFNAR